MNSPFPGMDPFIESAGHWPDFHSRFITYWCDAIADLLPEPYEVSIDERVRLARAFETKRKSFLPDVAILRRDRSAAARRAPVPAGVATLAPVAIPLPSRATVKVVERRLLIHKRPGRSLVAALELLSPSNKEGLGYGDYCDKRDDLLRQDVHLVELDLLLGGQRLPMGDDLPAGDYYALITRGGEDFSDVYPWTLRDSLPPLPIPLEAPDADLLFDLGAIVATAYERGRYASKLDYDASPPPLDAEDRAWAAERIRAWREQAAARPG